MYLDALVLWALVTISLELREAILEPLQAHRLAGESQPNHHHAVAHEHRVEELDDLGDVRGHRLKPRQRQLPLDGRLQHAILD